MTTYRMASRYQDDHLDAVVRELRAHRGGRWHGRSGLVARYESALAAAFGAGHAVACNSGTVAVELALRASSPRVCGRPGTVVMPSLAPVMTVLPALTVGARLVFYDSEPGTTFPGIESLGRVPAPPGSVVVTVPWWGYLPDRQRLALLFRERGWTWVEDAAQAHGSETKETPGPLVRCFSTHDRKLVTTGEGGFVLTDDADLARRLRSYASYGGYPPGSADLDLGFEEGTNARLSSMAAAMGLVSVMRLGEVVTRRRRIAQAVLSGVERLRHVRAHPESVGSRSNYYGLVFVTPARLPRHFGARYLAGHGIQTDVLDYDLRPVTQYPVTPDPVVGEWTNASDIASRLVVVSPHHGVDRDGVDYLVAVLTSLDDTISREMSRTGTRLVQTC
jgi:dTDP-4-amino-4,6-dideoxygalactose transaminase